MEAAMKGAPKKECAPEAQARAFRIASWGENHTLSPQSLRVEGRSGLPGWRDEI